MAVLKIILKKGVAKVIKFTYTSAGIAVDVSGATFTFVVKDEKDDSNYKIEKVNANFNKAEASVGIVKVTLIKSDLNIAPGTFVGEIRAYWSDSNIDLSKDILFIVTTPVYSS